jgi:hypothetical protein
MSFALRMLVRVWCLCVVWFQWQSWKVTVVFALIFLDQELCSMGVAMIYKVVRAIAKRSDELDKERIARINILKRMTEK